MSTYSRDTTAISELTSQPVSTWSEEWQHECEARAVLKMSKEERNVFFNGRKDENGKTVDRGVIGIPGPKAAVSQIWSGGEGMVEAVSWLQAASLSNCSASEGFGFRA